jgi:glycosyltransferase involved in cell wall biosynthesis
LQRLAAELGVAEAVRFCGRVANADMPALYASARVCVNPSLADNMPISVLESLASGVPVVSTRVGGVPHLVEHERTALLVEPGDAEAMAQAMLRLLRDPALAARLRAAGLDSVRRYDWASVRPKLLAVYQAAAGPAGVRAGLA